MRSFVQTVVGENRLYLGKNNNDIPVFLTGKGQIHKFDGYPPSPLRSDTSKPLFRKGRVTDIRIKEKNYKEIVNE